MDDRNAEFDGEAARGLAPWLDALSVPEADTGFRARVREQFVTAAGDPTLHSALDALPLDAARTEFKDALGEAFVSGSGNPAAADPSPQRGRRSVPSSARKQSWRFRLLGAATLAAAAALVLLLRTPNIAWELASEPVAVVVDGHSVSGAAELDDLLPGARTLESGDRALRLRFGDEVVIELGADSRVDLSAWLDPADDSRRALTVERGALRVATGPGFEREKRVLVASGPELDARVVGTAFGIDVYPERGTCLCVTEGTVGATERTDPSQETDVVGGHMRFAYKAGGAVAGDELIEAHKAPVVELAHFWD